MDERALLLTDVVDSTRLSQEMGDVAMAALWARQYRFQGPPLPPVSQLEAYASHGLSGPRQPPDSWRRPHDATTDK